MTISCVLVAIVERLGSSLHSRIEQTAENIPSFVLVSMSKTDLVTCQKKTTIF